MMAKQMYSENKRAAVWDVLETILVGNALEAKRVPGNALHWALKRSHSCTLQELTHHGAIATDPKRQDMACKHEIEQEYLTFCQLQVLYLIALPASSSICLPMVTLASVESSSSAASPVIDLVIGPSMRFIVLRRFCVPPFSAVAWSPEKSP